MSLADPRARLRNGRWRVLRGGRSRRRGLARALFEDAVEVSSQEGGDIIAAQARVPQAGAEAAEVGHIMVSLDQGWELSASVRSEADVFDAQPFLHLENIQGPITQGLAPGVTPLIGQRPQADYAACLCDQFHVFPGAQSAASGGVLLGTWAGVGIDQGFFGDFHAGPQGVGMGVGDINHEAEFLHPLDDLPAGRREAIVMGPGGHAIPEFIHAVVQQCDQPDAVVSAFIDLGGIPPQRIPPFDAE